MAVLSCSADGKVTMCRWIHTSTTWQFTQVPHYIHMAVRCCSANRMIAFCRWVYALITWQLTQVLHHILQRGECQTQPLIQRYLTHVPQHIHMVSPLNHCYANWLSEVLATVPFNIFDHHLYA